MVLSDPTWSDYEKAQNGSWLQRPRPHPNLRRTPAPPAAGAGYSTLPRRTRESKIDATLIQALYRYIAMWQTRRNDET
jgi:hypothetical protein